MINNTVNNGLRSVTTPEPSATLKQTSAANTVKLDKSVSTESPVKNSLAEDTAPAAETLANAVSKLNDFVQNVQRTLSFSVEENTGVTVVKVFDSETDELIRQIPAEDTIKLAASIEDNLATLLLKERA